MKSELIKEDNWKLIFCREISVLPAQAEWISGDCDAFRKFAEAVKPLLKSRRYNPNDRFTEKA